MLTHWPKLTVVTPSYNHASFLEWTLRSIHEQEYPNLEHVVLDAGSTDGSQDIIKRHESRLAHWESKPDNGQTSALIEGFRITSGEICCWVCSDDLVEAGSFREAACFFAEHPGALAVFGDSALIDAGGQLLRRVQNPGFNRWSWLYSENWIPQPSVFWKRELYDRVGGLDPSYDIAMDADLWARFAELTTLHHVPRQWSRMRFYPEAKSQRLRAQGETEWARIRERYCRSHPQALYYVKHAAARVMRVGWKISNGLYDAQSLRVR